MQLNVGNINTMITSECNTIASVEIQGL